MGTLFGEGGQLLKRGHELAGVLFPLERRLMKVVVGEGVTILGHPKAERALSKLFSRRAGHSANLARANMREDLQMKPTTILPLFGLAAFAAVLPTAASAQTSWSVSIGSGYGQPYYGNGYGNQYRQHDAQHDDLEDQHDDAHDYLDDEHARAHEEGVSRWEHRRLHGDLREEHRYEHGELNREHSRDHRRNERRRYRSYDNGGYSGY